MFATLHVFRVAGVVPVALALLDTTLLPHVTTRTIVVHGITGTLQLLTTRPPPS